MFKELPGFEIVDTVYTGKKSTIYRGIRKNNQSPIVFKALMAEYPTVHDITRLKHEYKILKTMDDTGIIHAHEIFQQGNQHFLVLQDTGGRSLDQILNSQKMALPDFFKIAIELAQILGRIHQKNIIHKDINPSNIILNEETGHLQIIDFGISTVLPRETQTLNNPVLLEGTLAYIAPEQTGRMNRTIDYRSDYYSLGATFYEMVTGCLPFPSDDPIELVHSHIAKPPIPPKEHNAGLSQVLNDIIMKLLAKTAEDRYQSSYGIVTDLQTCQNYSEKGETGSKFIPGISDISDQFRIPQHLYGREKEVTTLLNAFERVNGEGISELMLVGGYSGIGKTALIHEIHRPLTEKRGYFISGKFDQFHRNIPYASLIQAFRELVSQLLTENEEQLAQWKIKLMEALSPNGQVILELIPEMEHIIGEQSDVPALPPVETQNRLNLTFLNFMKVFTQKDHPLTLFLDDLQWADLASLNLIDTLLSSGETHYLLLIGAYRDNEVNELHPLMQMLNKVKKSQATVHTILLTPLNHDHLEQLISDTLGQPISQIRLLADLVFQKTQGNPFFVNQFLRTLHDDHLLKFQLDEGRWTWDLDHIAEQGITDNVVELMAGKIRKLPKNTQSVVQLAACVGHQFNLRLLAIVLEQGVDQVGKDIWEALNVGLIIPQDRTYRILGISEQEIDSDFNPNFRFLHDRVQQAAYSLIPEEEKPQLHLKIGQHLLEHVGIFENEDNLFDIVNQFNLGNPLLNKSNEKIQLSQLNLRAGKKARLSAAYDSAISYLTTGIELLQNEQPWQEHYDLTKELYELSTEVSYLKGDFEQMEYFGNSLLDNASNALDKIQVYVSFAQGYYSKSEPIQGIRTGLEGLALLGIEIPMAVTEERVMAALMETQTLLADKQFEDLIDLPEMTEPEALAAQHLISGLYGLIYQVVPELYPIVVCKAVNLSILHGNGPLSCVAYCNYAIVRCIAFEDYHGGYKLGQLAFQLYDRTPIKVLETTLLFLFHYFIRHWSYHIRESTKPFLRAYQVGLETGNLEWGSYAILSHGISTFYHSDSLSKAESVLSNCVKSLHRCNVEYMILHEKFYKQCALNLQGKSEDPCSLTGTEFDEVHLTTLRENGNTIFNFFLVKMLLAYLFQQPKQALENANAAEEFIGSVASAYMLPFSVFYDSLIRLAALSIVDETEKPALLEKVAKNQEQLKKWADHEPMNSLHKYQLVEAERCRLAGKPLEAMGLYDFAIKGAKEQKFIREEALGNELATYFYLSRGQEKVAKAYFVEARYLYERWGASAKVKHLEESLPHIWEPQKYPSSNATVIESSIITSSGEGISGLLDLFSVMKASEAISSEIILENLLTNLIQIAMENAGAQKGFLILTKDQQLVIEAEGQVDPEQVIVLQSISLETETNLLPMSILSYVTRTLKEVVLENATDAEQFSKDPYIVDQQPKSVMCVPLLLQGQLSGIIYLENNFSTGAFTQDRLKVLQLLSGQAAISMENAQLYDNLEQKVQERTQELSAALKQLKDTQAQLVQAEKMAGLGTLVAGVAHELNNPNNFIYTGSHNIKRSLNKFKDFLYSLVDDEDPDDILMEKLKTNFEDLERSTGVVIDGSERIQLIVKDLRTFSRLQEAGKNKINIVKDLQATLRLVKSKYEKQVEFIESHQEVPTITCWPAQLNQVFMNVITNGCQAIESKQTESQGFERGQLKIITTLENDQIVIQFIDSGCGMNEDVKSKIFEPFFTTRTVGEGTGLGMAVVYGIISQHEGYVEIDSAVGQGTTVTLRLPTSI